MPVALSFTDLSDAVGEATAMEWIVRAYSQSTQEEENSEGAQMALRMRRHETEVTEPVEKDTSKKLLYKVGIELTMMPEIASGKDSEDNRDRKIAQAYGSIIEQLLLRKKFPVFAAGGDFRAVEVSSKPLTTWGQVEKFYTTVSEVMLSLGLNPSHPNSIGGGGHVHVGPLPMKTRVNLFRECQNRPYLNWIFNEPDATETADSFTAALEDLSPALVDAAKKANFNPSVFVSSYDFHSSSKAAMLFFGNPDFVDESWMYDDKGHMLRYADGQSTLEFRFFAAPHSWEEQKRQLEFIEAMIRWVEKEYADKTAWATTTVVTMEQLQAITEAQAKENFTAFLTVLGLNPDDYACFVADHLAERYKRNNRA